MANQELVNYIMQQAGQGVSQEVLRNTLLQAGWQTADVDEALKSLTSSPVAEVKQSSVADTAQSERTLPESVTSFDEHTAPRFGKKLIILISVVGLLLVAGGVFAYNYFNQTPEQIVGGMVKTMLEAKTSNFSGDIKITIDTQDVAGFLPSAVGDSTSGQIKTGEGSVTIRFSGSSDSSNVSNPKVLSTFTFGTDILPFGGALLGFDMRIVDRALYLKLNNLGIPGTENFGSFKNQWIKFDSTTALTQLQQSGYSGSINLEENLNLPTEKIDKIKTILGKALFIKVGARLASERVGGVDSHHYAFSLNKEGLKNTLKEVSLVVQEKDLTEAELQGLDAFWENIEVSGELWIGKSDRVLHQIKMVLDSKSMIKTTVIINETFKNINEPVTINIPPDAKNFEELLFGISPLASGENIDTDGDGISDSKEAVLGTDPKKIDTDGDGYKDADEIKNGYNPTGTGRLPLIDTDKDGLLDAQEVFYSTQPNNPDTDGDGYKDGDEVKKGYNPLGEGRL